MMKKNIIKIKIKWDDTTIWYAKKVFKNRVQALKAAISHLERILPEVESE